MELDEIVMRLVGPVCAIGDSTRSADNHQASMKEIGVYVRDYLCRLNED